VYYAWDLSVKLAIALSRSSARYPRGEEPRCADWLEKLGMPEYAQRFAENDIDFAILGDLTDQDLKELGVSSLGHRRKLLRAIAELGSAPATALVACSAPRPVEGSGRGRDRAHRRRAAIC
jgi:SAM domain (Sterile alpha motif)